MGVVRTVIRKLTTPLNNDYPICWSVRFRPSA